LPRNILLVCTGNTCRSPMAAALLAARLGDRCRVQSAGTAALPGEPASEFAVRVMAERGLDLSGHRSRPLVPELVAGADLVLTMTRGHRQAVVHLCPAAADRTFTLREFAGCPLHPPQGEDLDIPDPLGGSEQVYRQVADELARLVDAVAARMARFETPGGEQA
jgi:protein-tyrosine-phosphatase